MGDSASVLESAGPALPAVRAGLPDLVQPSAHGWIPADDRPVAASAKGAGRSGRNAAACGLNPVRRPSAFRSV